MNAKWCRILFAFVGLILSFAARPLAAQTNLLFSNNCVCVRRMPHERMWQNHVIFTNGQGAMTTNTHLYTEVATGLCYLTNGQYADSVEQIDPVADGAQATQGQHKVHWTANANTAGGAVSMTTPDDKQLLSTVYGLMYYDTASGSNVLLAPLQDCTATIVGSNTLIYTNAFSNLTADLRYTYRKGGVSQDVILKQKPPLPGEFGLNPATTWLQVVTEFFNSPNPVQTTITNQGVADARKLNFGQMSMGVGRAFRFQTNSHPRGGVSVTKHWWTLDNRTFLVEEVPYNSITNLLSSLQSSTMKPDKGRVRRTVFFESPKTRKTAAIKPVKTIHNLKSSFSETAVVMDYDLSLTESNFVFQGDTTYYVSDECTLAGTTTLEGGTVIKYATNGTAQLDIESIDCQTGPYRPAVFTSINDNSIGAQIDGSTGDPSQDYAGNCAIYMPGGTATLSNVRFNHLNIVLSGQGAAGQGGDFTLADFQILNCQIAFYGDGFGYAFYNGLIYNIENTVLGTSDDPLTANIVNGYLLGENLTLHDCADFELASENIIYLTNSLIIQVTNFESELAQAGAWDPNSPSTNTCAILDDDTGIFQTVGAGAHYLADNTYRNASSTNIDPNLLSDLQSKTTWPPTNLPSVITNALVLNPYAVRDTNGTDLGYHYDPIDYTIASSISDATITVQPGTSIAATGAGYGPYLSTGASLQFMGTPSQVIHFGWYNTVQEQANTNWETSSARYLIDNVGSNALLNFSFTQWSTFGGFGSDNLLLGSLPDLQPINLMNCQFYGGRFRQASETIQSTNCLYDRVILGISNGAAPIFEIESNVFRNNLFIGGAFVIYHKTNYDSQTWIFSDNLFDQVPLTNSTFSPSDISTHNAYVTNGYGILSNGIADVFLDASPVYETGTLGKYYYPGTQTNLIHTGSQLASGVGLSQYTVTTNNAREDTNMVSIGFHYVATDTNGIPLDLNSNGIPDYLESTSSTNALPDWWQMLYFGQLGIDPSGNLSGDGIDNWDKYILGLNPNISYVSQLMISPPGGNYINTPSITIFSFIGSSIRYTIDGSIPSATNGISISSGVLITNLPSTNFILKAWESGLISNIPAIATYYIVPAAPAFSVNSGVYNSGTSLHISCATSNAVVYYTTNGVNPTTNSFQIQATNIISLTTNVTVKAVAGLGTNLSPMTSQSYLILPTTFSAPPANDDYSNAIVLSGMSGEFSGTAQGATVEAFESANFLDYFWAAATSGATVWYKWTAPSTGSVFFDVSKSGGSDIYNFSFIAYDFPLTNGPNPTNLIPAGYIEVYPGEFGGSGGYSLGPDYYLNDPTSYTLLATNGITYYFCVDYVYGLQEAFDVSWRYVTQEQAPVFSPPGGSYSMPESVIISDLDTNTVIRYTLTGIDPTTNDAVIPLNGTVTITNTTTLKAAAWRPGLDESAVVSAIYTLTTNPTLNASAPILSPSNTVFTNSITVTLTCTNPGAAIYYTLDGTLPTLANTSTVSGGTLTFSNSAIVSAVAWLTNMNLSPVTVSQYAAYGADTAGDGISDSFKLQSGLNILIPQAGNIYPNPFAHGLNNLQVYLNQSVLLADNYSTLNDGVPDWWLVQNGYSVSTPANAVGANGQTLLASFLAGLFPNNPGSQAGQMPPIDFHMVHGPSNSMVMVLDAVRPGMAAYVLTCQNTDQNLPSVAEEFSANQSLDKTAPGLGRYFQMTNQLSPGSWLFTMQGRNSDQLWSTTSSNTFGRYAGNYDFFEYSLNQIESTFSSWTLFSGMATPVVGYTNNNDLKEPLLAQILRAESDTWNDLGGSASYNSLLASPVLYDSDVKSLTTETSWGTLTFQFVPSSNNPSYYPTNFASYFNSICSTADVGVDCGDFYADLWDGVGYTFPDTELAPLYCAVDTNNEYQYFVMATNTFNPAGLAYLSLTFQVGDDAPVTLLPGKSNMVPNSPFTFEVALNTEVPTFKTTNYFFDGRPYPLSSTGGFDYESDPPATYAFTTSLVASDWLLLQDDFTPFPIPTTNPIIIAQVGKPVNLQSWSQVLAVGSNGTITNTAYCIDQDFAHAYLCNPATGDVSRTSDQNYNGIFKIDTNNAVETGILSPNLNFPQDSSQYDHGWRSADFTPTQVGKVIVTTMPDSAGNYGEVAVYVIDMQVDANHDGVMDDRDLTSVNNPMPLWANNNYDRYVPDEDDGVSYDDSVQTAPTADCNYVDPSTGQYAIPTVRDLQDYFRLWTPGLSNVMASVPTNYSVTLQWRNNTGAAIRLFRAAETNGGTNYLFDQSTGAAQINFNSNTCYGYVWPNQPLDLGTEFRTWILAPPPNSDHFIFCGAGIGNDELVLQVRNPYGGVVGEASVFLNIQDIKQMYERWSVGESISAAPNNLATNCGDDGSPSFRYPYDPSVDSAAPYILYVHGWNMQTWEKDRFAESACKRLYWQGYQGRFGVYRWPTGNGFEGYSTLISNPTEKDNYDLSEYQAWQSATGLYHKLFALNSQYPGRVYMLAHSMGNIVAGEALRLAGTTNLVNTYVASQAAITAHTYDATVANYSFSDPPWSASAYTPNIYGNWFATNIGYAASQIINFYNVNDFALERSHWQTDQLLKPDQDVSESDGLWDYGYSGATNDPPSLWTNFFKMYANETAKTNFYVPSNLYSRYEVMALAAQPYTTALGATAGISTLPSLDLTTVWTSDPGGNSYAEHFWHSAQFRGDYWMEKNYWQTLLRSSQLGFGLGQ